MPYHVPDVPEILCDTCGPLTPGAQYVPEEAVDGPQHCASEAACQDYVDLRQWGLKPGDTLHGAESWRIGALLYDELTRDGVEYLKYMLSEPDRTPYQDALHTYWRAVFSAYLPDA